MAVLPIKIGRTTKLIVGFAATIFFVYLIASELEWDQVSASIVQAKFEWLAVSLLCMVIGTTIRIFRWWLILKVKARDLTLKACVWPMLLGMWLNIVIPFRAGDIVRAFGFREQLRSPGSRILGLLVIERALDVIAVLIVFFIGMYSVANADVIPKSFSMAALIFAALAVLGLLVMILMNRPMKRFLHWIVDLPLVSGYEIVHQIRGWLNHFFDGISSIRKPKVLANVVVATIGIWLLEGLTYYTVAIAVGITESPMAPWFSFATATLATAIPSTPGFVGTFDYFAALGMSAFGVDWNTATVFAVITHIVVVLPFASIMLGYGIYKLFKSQTSSQNV